MSKTFKINMLLVRNLFLNLHILSNTILHLTSIMRKISEQAKKLVILTKASKYLQS